MRATTLRLGSRVVDVEDRPLVMGVLDLRAPEADTSLDDLVRRAGDLVGRGADLLDLEIAGGAHDLDVQEEVDLVVRAVGAVGARVDVPLSVTTSRTVVARAAFGAGATVANDRAGCGDSAYLAAVAECGATVVAGHAGPLAVGPDGVVDAVRAFLVGRVEQARSLGVPPDRIVLDAGLGHGKSALQALALLRASDRLADLGHPLLLSVADTTFVGAVPGLADGPGAPSVSLAATALGTALGCRLVRTRDVAAHRQACVVMAAVNGAGR